MMAVGRRLAATTIAVGALLIVLGFAAPAAAGTLTWSGALEPGDPTWDRPTCTDSTQFVEFYDQQAFHVTAAGSYSITMPTMTGSVSPDGYFLLYVGSFDPAAPTTNCIAEDDDSGEGLAPALTVDLAADTTYVLVTTQCCDGTTAEEGIAYTNEVTGLGEVILGQVTTTTTTSSTTTSTTVASTTTTAAVTTTTVAPTALARTGGTLVPLASLGAALLATGVGILVALRRRTAA